MTRTAELRRRERDRANAEDRLLLGELWKEVRAEGPLSRWRLLRDLLERGEVYRRFRSRRNGRSPFSR